MPVITTKKELQRHLSSSPNRASLGLVPTMGALHPGHAALVRQAVAENETVVVSIFVNPTQFENNEDLDKYPDTFEKDILLLEEITKDVVVFAPTADEIYEHRVQSKTYDFEGLDKVMEGAFRDGHFNGVGTIVETLLHLVAPDKAYFGEKDFQQLQIVRKLVAKKDIPVTIIGCPVVREANGLAMSSRNGRLSEALRQEASFIYKTLRAAKKKFGTKSAVNVMDWARKQFEGHPDLRLEYFVIADVETLTPIQKKKPEVKYRAFAAVYADGVRLIDNIALN
ncbi:pantoate--beta-alanine ligase [Pricia sp. S334]|uniref:Pantothenate synthetase n=1 Tax=Pricia mediterranea TaxID=3076079 RepID=A0ABU3L672_9FLAO|nr:pantoate--beta-alanine ligase [Pricia sp. S334]MDT7829155.1 pantoate--beta-alanine ligase [Pricia sp. S334]